MWWLIGRARDNWGREVPGSNPVSSLSMKLWDNTEELSYAIKSQSWYIETYPLFQLKKNFELFLWLVLHHQLSSGPRPYGQYTSTSCIPSSSILYGLSPKLSIVPVHWKAFLVIQVPGHELKTDKNSVWCHQLLTWLILVIRTWWWYTYVVMFIKYLKNKFNTFV